MHSILHYLQFCTNLRYLQLIRTICNFHNLYNRYYILYYLTLVIVQLICTKVEIVENSLLSLVNL